jgi:hypothetical protein
MNKREMRKHVRTLYRIKVFEMFYNVHVDDKREKLLYKLKIKFTSYFQTS